MIFTDKNKKEKYITRGIIGTSGELIKELKRLKDDVITVKVNEEEYIIETIIHEKDYMDDSTTHLCLLCRDGGKGGGNIKR